MLHATANAYNKKKIKRFKIGFYFTKFTRIYKSGLLEGFTGTFSPEWFKAPVSLGSIVYTKTVYFTCMVPWLWQS